MTDRLDNIAIFVAVAEHESFAEAARRLNRTPAAITRAVATLEEHLRIRLLNRTTRSVSLTDEGARYLEVSRRLLAAYGELEGLETQADRVQPHGILQVTAPAMFGRLHVLPAISSFLSLYPKVDIRALFLDRVVSLVDEGIDVGIRLGDLPDSSLRAVRAGQISMGVYASPDYLARHGTPQTPQDLGNHATISSLAVHPIPDRWSFDGAGGVGHVAIKPRLVVNTNDAAADAAAAGLGLIFQVCYQVDAHLRSGALQQVLVDFAPPSFPIHVVHPAGRFVPAKLRLFIDHVAQELRGRFGSAHNVNRDSSFFRPME
jgi:DNA-binding transcriptional LysR family regulator